MRIEGRSSEMGEGFGEGKGRGGEGGFQVVLFPSAGRYNKSGDTVRHRRGAAAAAAAVTTPIQATVMAGSNSVLALAAWPSAWL